MKRQGTVTHTIAPAFAVVFAASMGLSQAQPANDLFANRTVVSGTNVVATGSNVGATREASEPYIAGNAGGASVWWSWTAPSDGYVTISTAGSSFDTTLGVYQGTSVSSLNWVADNDDESANIVTSKLGFEVVDGQTYQIAVDGYDGDTGSIRLQIQVGAAPVAAAWTLPNPQGTMVDWSTFAGKVVILDFWATWCGPCRSEIPDLDSLQNQYGPDGLVIIGASVDDTSQAVVNFLASTSPPLDYQVVMADYATQEAYGGISAIPTTFIIDRHEVIRQRYVGTQPESTFVQAILPLLYANTRLACERIGNQIRLHWPKTAASFTLESSASLSNPTWSPWPAAPTVQNGMNVVSVPVTGGPRYFRLALSE